MPLCEEVGDFLVGLSSEQVGVFAVEIEVFLWAESVVLKYVHRSLNEILHK